MQFLRNQHVGCWQGEARKKAQEKKKMKKKKKNSKESKVVDAFVCVCVLCVRVCVLLLLYLHPFQNQHGQTHWQNSRQDSLSLSQHDQSFPLKKKNNIYKNEMFLHETNSKKYI